MIVYKITNTSNEKVYIGITIRSLHNRWVRHVSSAKLGSRSPLHAAIRKYGPSCFVCEMICSANTTEELKQLEVQYIQQFNTYNHGYNATKGGDGTFGKRHTEETRKRIRAGLARARVEGRFLNDQWLVNCRRARAQQTGVPLSPSHCENISKALKGRPKNSGAGKQPIAVEQFGVNGEYIAVHQSYAAAALAVASNPSDIMRACQGKRKTVKGYKFQWASKNTGKK